MFCVQCGKETTDLSERGLCAECFAKGTDFLTLPDRVDVEMCVHCGSRKRGEMWLQPARIAKQGKAPVDLDAETLAETLQVVEEAAIEAAAVDKRIERPAFHVEARMQDQHGRMWATKLRVSGRAENFPLTDEDETVVRVKGATCLRCSRMQGGYHEAIVQVRATNRDMSRDEIASARRIASRLIERIVGQGDASAFVLKDIEIEGGIDIYFGTTNAGRMAAKAIAQELGGRTTEHAKLVGQKDGLDLYRMTFALRVPPYRRGDLVIVDDEPWLIQSVPGKSLVLRRTDGGRTRTVNSDTVERAVILPRDSAKEAVVVSRTEKELQVLDPTSYATVSVLRPAGIGDEDATVPVVRWEEELLVVPPVRLPREDDAPEA